MASDRDSGIVISGISGRYPESANIQQFWDNLLSGQELSSIDNRRWPVGELSFSSFATRYLRAYSDTQIIGLHDLPKRSGKVPDAQKFDAEFFQISEKDANLMDPQVRIFHETTFEAIVDAGFDPEDLKGPDTGVYIGWCYNDTDSAMKEDESKVAEYLQLASNRLSATFGFKGISIGMDTACASSLTAFHQAVIALRTGECSTAVVGGWAIHARPSLAVCFHQLGMISNDGRSKCMDASADGYCRSEAIVSIVLQRACIAKRVYANLLNARTNTDGYKEEGITFPSMKAQEALMNETYAEIGMHVHSVDYVEAHMTGTAAGDPVESAAIAAVFCKDRANALPIGCLKSNMGHSEGASGLCAITKSCLMLQRKEVPPNLHFQKANGNIQALKKGQFAPITERQAFNGKTIGVNCFGFGGTNVHVVIQGHEKSLTSDSFDITAGTGFLRLVHISNRTAEGLDAMRNHMQHNGQLTREWLKLLDEVSYMSPSRGLRFRSFVLLDEERRIVATSESEVSDENCSRPVALFFPGFASRDFCLTHSFLSLLPVRTAIAALRSSSSSLCPFDVEEMLLSPSDQVKDSLFKLMLYQILVCDMLRAVGLRVDSVIGSSVGNVASAFAAGILTLEQAFRLALVVRDGIRETKSSLVTRVSGVDEESLKEKDLSAAKSQVVSRESVSSFVVVTEDREKKGCTLSPVESSHGVRRQPLLPFSVIASALMPDKPAVMDQEKEKPGSWLTSGTTKSTLTATDLFNSIVNSSDWTQAYDHVAKNSLVLEIGSQAQELSACVTRALGPDIAFVSMSADLTAAALLSAVGQLYVHGKDIVCSLLHDDSVRFPVPQETQSLSHLIRWQHERDWLLVKMPDYFDYVKSNQTFVFDLMEPKFQYMTGHCVDGRILLPATGYLWLVWDIFAHLNGYKGDAGRVFLNAPVEFRDIEFKRATILSKSSPVTVNVLILTSSGKFQVTEGGTTCVSGYIRLVSTDCSTAALEADVQSRLDEDAVTLTTADIYKEMRVRGYDYGPSFQNLIEAASDGSFAKVRWNGNWVSFTDSLLQLAIVSNQKRELFLPTSIQFLKCDIQTLMHEVDNCVEKVIEVRFDKLANTGCCRGLLLKGLKASPVTRRVNQQPLIESYKFTPYDEDIEMTEAAVKQVQKYVSLCQQMTDIVKQGMEIPADVSNAVSLYGSQDQSLLKALESAARDDAPVSKEQLLAGLRTCDETLVTRISLENEDLTRVPIDIVLENCDSKLEIVEMNRQSNRFFHLLSNLTALTGTGSSYSVSTAESGPVLPPNVTVLKNGLPADCKAHFIVINDNSADLLFKSGGNFDSLSALTACADTVSSGAFVLILARERVHDFETDLCSHLNVQTRDLISKSQILSCGQKAGLLPISVRRDSLGFMAVLMRKPLTDLTFASVSVKILDYAWIEDLKKLMAEKGAKHPIWLTATDSTANGVVGMITCLRKEDGGKRLRCLFAPDDNKNNSNTADENNNNDNNNDIIPKELLAKDLVVNVIRNERIGSFRYRTVKETEISKEVTDAVLDVGTKGDLSSLRFCQSRPHRGKHTYQVHYSALNFKDVMIASGRIPPNAYPDDGYDDSVKGSLGMEFSGVDSNGRRVMGMVPGNGIATTISLDGELFTWQVPDNWTLEEAATVPVVYFTCYYALFVRANIAAGDRVLIHAASGGVGQAALSICLSLGCQVFATVGSQAKRQFIRKTYPAIDDDHILDSRSVSFEEHIMRLTDGQGVDIVLNSLSEDKQQAGIRCLAEFGRFLEIGKYDIIQNHDFNPNDFTGNRTFHAICVAHLIHDVAINASSSALQMNRRIRKLMMDGMAKGEVRPIRADVFHRNQVEEAFRFMASGKHMGKVLIRMRNEDEVGPHVTVKSIQKTHFSPDKVYIVTGGLGGFGLEVAQWLIASGARKLLLTSRSGVKTAYQRLAVRRMQRKCASLLISSADLLTRDSAVALIQEAESLNGAIGGIFHLAMVLSDAVVENQTAEKFAEVCGSKVSGSVHLDDVSRALCPELSHFVCFSSVASGRGNAGQGNYGFANSAMERLCEVRVRDGVPGLALQWGAIGDVGVVAELMGGNDVVIGGSVPQRMPSCFSTLDRIMAMATVSDKDSRHPCPVFSSIVPAGTKRTGVIGDGSEDLLKVVCHVLGVKDPDSLSDEQTLGDLGMDSLMAVEIRQGLERDYDVVMSSTEVRQLTIGQIKELSEKRKSAKCKCGPAAATTAPNFSFTPSSADAFVKLNSSSNGKVILFFPSIDCNFANMGSILSHVVRPVIGVNWTPDCDSHSSLSELGQHFARLIRSYYLLETEFDLMGHSFGCLLALHTAIHLQNASGPSVVKKLLLVDGSPESLKLQMPLSHGSDPRLAALTQLVSLSVPSSPFPMLEKKLSQVAAETRVLTVIDLLKEESGIETDAEAVESAVTRYQKKVSLMHALSPESGEEKFIGKVRLVRPSACVTRFSGREVRVAQDYGLGSLITGDCDVVTLDGDSASFLSVSNADIALQIDSFYRHIVFA